MKISGVFDWWDTIHEASYPELAVGFPLDQDDWNCYEWQAYFDKLKGLLGVAGAVSVWNIDAENSGIWSNVKNNCIYDCSFYQWQKVNGLVNYGGVISASYCGITESVVNVADVVTDVTGAASDVSSLIFPVTALVIVGGLLYLNKKYLK